MTTLALSLIVGQAVVVLLLMHFIRTFGRFKDEFVATHRANRLLMSELVATVEEAANIQRGQMDVTARLEALHSKREVA